MSTYIIGITGASGAIYGIRLLEYLADNGHKIYLSVTKEGFSIIKDEIGIDWEGDEAVVNKKLRDYFNTSKDTINYFTEDNFNAPIASGSVKVDGMAVVPCSMKALSAIANGFSSNLIERAADVTLKEKRMLIIVPRETPLNRIHLENMLRLSGMGVYIVPPNSAFYNHPKTVDDMVNFVIGRILDSLNIENDIYKRWK
ncbi:MAG: UbiX family flavin prenyltransferase [Nitrospirae bacterium]|nr:UbiX family flavin prenyltransferase [Nitrospirota bacterium]